jgi:hypothetical protein
MTTTKSAESTQQTEHEGDHDMGEYANYGGQSIKIGTCEDMYYIRLDHLPWLTPEDNSLNFRNPEVLRELRFRFPFPDEDLLRPGGFSDHSRGVRLEGVSAPYGVNHDSYRLKEPCSQPKVIEIVQQRIIGDFVCLIGRCPECGNKFNYPDIEHIIPVFDAIKARLLLAAETDHLPLKEEETPEFWLEVAVRIAAGYGIAPKGSK